MALPRRDIGRIKAREPIKAALVHSRPSKKVSVILRPLTPSLPVLPVRFCTLGQGPCLSYLCIPNA